MDQPTQELRLALRAPALAQISLALVRYHVTTLIVAPVGNHPSAVLCALTGGLGRSPERRDGLFVWYPV